MDDSLKCPVALGSDFRFQPLSVKSKSLLLRRFVALVEANFSDFLLGKARFGSLLTEKRWRATTGCNLVNTRKYFI